MKRNRYTTSYKQKYQLGLLSFEQEQQIPRSTRHDWLYTDFAVLIGFADGEESLSFLARKTTQFCELLFAALKCYYKIAAGLSNKKKILRQHRKAIIETIEQLCKHVSVYNACQLMQVSVQQFYRWKNERPCETSPYSSCRKVIPQQLLPEEIAVVKKYMLEAIENGYSLIDGYYRMMHDGAAAMTKNTFYKIGRLLGMKAKRYKKQKPKTGVRASRAFQILHIDVTRIRLVNGTPVFIQFITDNFSRAILGAKASLTWNATSTVENLKGVCKQYRLYCRPLQLYCDNGSENQGALNGFLARHDVDIEKVVAQIDVPFSNSMAEAANKRAKYYHLFHRRFESLQQVQAFLPELLSKENTRYHYALYGLTPDLVLSGQIPDKAFFKSKIQQAQANRLVVNRARKCKSC